MDVFISDLLADLREKRLWPIALALIIALIAVPVVLSKSAAPPPLAPTVADDHPKLPDLGVKVLAGSDQAGAGSALDLFDPRDPFRPPQSVLDAAKAVTTPAPAPAVGALPSAGVTTTGTTSSVGGPSIGGSSPGGGGGSEPTSAPAAPKAAPKAQAYSYVIDVTYTRGIHSRKIKGMTRLDMLPSSTSPLLVFLGVDSKAANAVFLADSSLQLYGEGKCKPSDDDCNFLYLGAGSRHFFSDQDSQNPDGQNYSIQIDAIRKVKVRAAAKASSHKSTHKSSKPKQSSASSQPKQASSRRSFVPPMLVDLVMSTDAADKR